MGMGEIMSAWQHQTLYFGHDRGQRFTVLLVENRGIGRSGKPWSLYSTTQMANEVIQVFDHVGWTGNREINLIGISLGGMILQRVACTVPERIQSLILLSTAAKFFEGLPSLAESRTWLSLIRFSEKGQFGSNVHLLFPYNWLASLDVDGEPSPTTTPRYKLAIEQQHIFESNFQRIQAYELNKRRDGNSYTLCGLICQVVATTSHRVPGAKLRPMADPVGRGT